MTEGLEQLNNQLTTALTKEIGKIFSFLDSMDTNKVNYLLNLILHKEN